MAAYLWIEGLKGTSTKSGHKNETEIETIQFGGQRGQNVAMARPGGPTTFDARSLGDLTITKRSDSLTPIFVRAAVAGDHFPRMVVTLSQHGAGGGVALMIWDFTDVIVSQIAPSRGAGMGDPISIETVSFNFADVKFHSASTIKD